MIPKVILAGCGNMGYAMLKGWIESGKLSPKEVTVVEPNEALRERAGALGVEAVDAADAVAADASPALIVFAVKPQVMREVVPAYRRFAERGATYLSVAAGTRASLIADLLGGDVPVIRCMPNTPAAIGRGMMVTYSNSAVGEGAESFVRHLLTASGKVASIGDEALMDAVTAVSGSGPAYVFHFIECFIEAAKATGLPDDVATLLATQTVYGAASLAAKTKEDPGLLRRQVTSPNGTTAAALNVLMRDGELSKMLHEAVEAARKRSIELG